MTVEELNDLISEHGRHVFSFCCNLTGDCMEAEDLYQDTFLKAVELCHRLDSSGNPKSYLMGISVKLWQNHKKKYAVRQKILPTEELDDDLIQAAGDQEKQPEMEMIRKESIDQVQTGIKQLPEKIRTVIYLYYTAELSVEEIGRALHIPKGTVKSRLHKGRILVKEYLEVQGYE